MRGFMGRTVVAVSCAVLFGVGCDKKAETPPSTMTAPAPTLKAAVEQPSDTKQPDHPTAADAGTPAMGAAVDSTPDAGAGPVMAAAGSDAGGTMAAGGAGSDEAKQIFTSRCAACHGAEGKGDGLAAAALNPKPRNFQDKAWQTSVTDEHIEKIIAGGGAAVGKSPTMPPNPDLAGKPVIQELRKHVRGLAK